MRYIKMLIMLFAVHLTIIQFVESGCDTRNSKNPTVTEVKLGNEPDWNQIPIGVEVDDHRPNPDDPRLIPPPPEIDGDFPNPDNY
ncbi:hypothetical protein Smp_191670 [Schistosoma mansoni]|uniref:Secreted protein n=1 Tax=Schistosoma mansoni TaxID=6183 RepID=A0A3Q0KU33_SCHMA|nr:hypothetical protein Smp_191670 [Schistosoma mansoni]|eukprot:XP_018653435.1 hypothetical protein Smp_191670 [Schistosoma mansoni]